MQQALSFTTPPLGLAVPVDVGVASATPAARGRWKAAPVARLVLPWLLSTTLHLAIFLAIALNLRFMGGWLGMHRSTEGLGKREFIDTSFGVDADNTATLGMTLPGGADKFYADEPPEMAGGAAKTVPIPDNTTSAASNRDANPSSAPTTANQKTNAGAQSNPGPVALAALGDGPRVDLASMLPAAGVSLGGSGLDGGGIGSARGAGNSNRPSRGVAGGQARTGVFGVEGEGSKFVYVFDRSGSMDGHGGAPIAAAKSQLIASLRDLGPTHQFQIIFYNERPLIFNPSGTPGKLIFANPQNVNQATRFIEATPADGATEHEEALSLALRMGPDVIFFLTDADEPRLSIDQLDRLGRMNRGSMINTIEFGYGPPLESNNFLVQLAQRNGGKHVYVDISRLPAAR
jgi:hypothetical protein